MNNQQAAPKVPEHSKRLAKLRSRICACAVVANGELGVSLSQEDMLTIAWALDQMSDPIKFAGSLKLPTEASSDDETWRYLPQRALLVPPRLGPDASELAAVVLALVGDVSEIHAVVTAWLEKLAVRIRNGECSPEQALLAAVFVAEHLERLR
jgi:hypothetical protein